jgi:hypothetical protein
MNTNIHALEQVSNRRFQHPSDQEPCPRPLGHWYPPLEPWHDRMLFYQIIEGRAMSQAVSRRLLTAETWVRARVSPCGMSGGHSDTGKGLSPSHSVFPVNNIPPWLSTLIHHLWMNNRFVRGLSSETWSQPIDMKKKKKRGKYKQECNMYI